MNNRSVSVEESLLFVLAAVAVVVLVRWIADRTGLPAAALLPVIGIGYALLPGPNVSLDPEIILTFVIPPLLYSAALSSSLIAIRRNLRTVVSLSVMLVLLTALVIGVGFMWFVAGATLAAGIALGAAVAPPDPVAALAIGRKVGLPPRLTTIVQGEGLLNDATALTILAVAVSAATGDGFSAPSAFGKFLFAAAGGVAVGAAVAYLVRLLSRPLGGDPLIANAVSLATPFGAYLLAEEAARLGCARGGRRGPDHRAPPAAVGLRREPAADQRGLAAGRLPARGLRVPADRPAVAGGGARAREVRREHDRRPRWRSRSAWCCCSDRCGCC